MPLLTQHIRLDSAGIAWVDDTPYKVTQIIQEALAYGWSPEEIVYQHYGDLTLAQVHAALSFYYDNRQDIDSLLEKESEAFKNLRQGSLDSPARQKLRAKGLVP